MILIIALALLPSMAFAAENLTVDDWTETFIQGGSITLDEDGDELTLLADTGPASAVKIIVSAPDGSSVTIRGCAGVIYEDLYIEVRNNNITLNLEDLSIVAPEFSDLNRKNAVFFVKWIDNSTPVSGTINVTGACSLAGGKSTHASGQGGYAVAGNSALLTNINISGSGTLMATGGEGHYGGLGFHVRDLTIGAETTAVGGESTQGSNDAALVSGTLTVNAALLATGGNSSNHVGGQAIVTKNGIVANAPIIAAGGNGVQGGMAIFLGDAPLSGSSSITATGGNGTSSLGGNGIAVNALTIDGLSITATGGSGGVADVSGFGGRGIQATNLSIISGTVIATGGDGLGGGGTGINAWTYMQSGGTVTATGGNGTADGFSGGAGLYVYNDDPATQGDVDIEISGGTITAQGGDGVLHGAHGIFSYYGPVEINNGADVISTGGDTTGTAAGNMGGVGLRAFGWDGAAAIGQTITIENDAGDICIRGGTGSTTNGQRPSMMGKDIYIATGNIGVIAKESGAAALTVKNIPGGDELAMLTVTLSPAADKIVTSTVTTTAAGLAPNYSYSASAMSDGIASMWLPRGSQTVSADGYASASKQVTADNLAELTLTPPTYISSHTVTFDSNGGSAVGSQTVTPGSMMTKPGNPTRENYIFAGWYTDEACTKPFDFNTAVTGNFTLYAKWIANFFTDINSHWAEVYINSLAGQDYIVGIGGGKFDPEGLLTRAQLVQLIFNAFADDITSYPAAPFTDTDPGAWYTAAINWAHSKGLITGYNAVNFGPDDYVTREQMAAMFMRTAETFNIAFTETAAKKLFADDTEIAHYAKDAVYAMQQAGIIQGKENNLFDPQGNTKRCEAAKVFHGVLEAAGKIADEYK